MNLDGSTLIGAAILAFAAYKGRDYLPGLWDKLKGLLPTKGGDPVSVAPSRAAAIRGLIDALEFAHATNDHKTCDALTKALSAFYDHPAEANP